jgi:hypothetical protein
VQLDQSPSQSCAGGCVSFSNLPDGDHRFSVAMISSSGAEGASEFSWVIGKHFRKLADRFFCSQRPSCIVYQFRFKSDRDRHLVDPLFADTVAPTAVVEAAQAFTNTDNVTMNITFSKTCEYDGGVELELS